MWLANGGVGTEASLQRLTVLSPRAAEQLCLLTGRAVAIMLLLAAVVVPLVVKLAVVNLPGHFAMAGYANPVLDGFSWYKSLLVCCLGAATAICLALNRPRPHLVDAFCLLLAVLALLSAWLSPFARLSLVGVPYLFESLPTSLAYLALMAGATRLSHAFTQSILAPCLVCSSLLVAAIGLLEANRIYIYNEPWFSSLFLSFASGAAATYRAATAAPAAPFGNPDYVGMYAAMMWPLFATLALARRSWRETFLYFLGASTMFVLVLDSQTRSAIIGGAVACLFGAAALSFGTGRWPLVRTAALASVHALAYALAIRCSQMNVPERLATIPPSFQQASFTPPPAATLATPVGHPAVLPTVQILDGRLRIDDQGDSLLIERLPDGLKFMTLHYRPLGFSVKGDRIIFNDDRYRDWSLRQTSVLGLDTLEVNGLQVAATDRGFRVLKRGAFVRPIAGERFPLPVADAAFSHRGYIWSRSLPLLRDTLWLGHGAGAFPFDFPNNDLWSMQRELGADAAVDKPHSFYIGFAHTHGVLALVVLLSLLAALAHAVGRSLRQRARAPKARLIPYASAVLGFAIAALANDSTVGVAAPFWILLGVALGNTPLGSRRSYRR